MTKLVLLDAYRRRVSTYERVHQMAKICEDAMVDMLFHKNGVTSYDREIMVLLHDLAELTKDQVPESQL